MKKWIALAAALLLLAVGLIFLLRPGKEATPTAPPETTGAPAALTSTQTPTEPTTTEAPQPSLTGLVAVEELEITEDEGIFDLYCADGMGYILLQRWDQQLEGLWYRMAALDAKTAALTEITELAAFPTDMGLSQLVVTESEILLIDEYGERCGCFDRTGAFLGFRDYPTMSQENRGWRNRLLSDDCFWKNSDYAAFTSDSGFEPSRVVAFYDEEDRLHALQQPFDAIEAASGHRLLTRRQPPDNSLTYTLLDLDEALCLGEAVLPPEADGAGWANPCGAALGEDYALLAVEWSGAGSTGYQALFWYPEPEEQTPFDQEILTEQSLTDRIEALKTELEPLGFTFHLDEAPEPVQTPTVGLNVSESVCDLGASLLGQYRILSELKRFADKLPEGFIRELSGQMPNEDENRDSLHIFIVRDVPGDAAAFANIWTEPLMVCFATGEFSESHLAHEFMHIIDYRLHRYSSAKGRDYEGDWQALSPAWAYDEAEWLDDAQLAEVGEYFVSDYARTNDAEDRAETFQMLFDSPDLSEEWWYSDSPKIQAKVARLIETIREAFPSVQAVERAWWEKLPE